MRQLLEQGSQGLAPQSSGDSAPAPVAQRHDKETPGLAMAYSMEAISSSNALLPALRTTNNWPGVTSKIQLAGARESAQAMIPAHGA